MREGCSSVCIIIIITMERIGCQVRGEFDACLLLAMVTHLTRLQSDTWILSLEETPLVCLVLLSSIWARHWLARLSTK
jgi:hypothetical protein